MQKIFLEAYNPMAKKATEVCAILSHLNDGMRIAEMEFRKRLAGLKYLTINDIWLHLE